MKALVALVTLGNFCAVFGDDPSCIGAAIGADKCLSVAKLQATPACQEQLAMCLSNQSTTGCSETLPRLLALHASNVTVQWWAQTPQIQSLFVCGMRLGALNNSVAAQQQFCSETETVGSLSREVMAQYCAPQIKAGLLRCPEVEHHDCCSCHSASFPTVPDNGHCCADCAAACDGKPAVLPPGDRCAGIALGEEDCDPLDLLHSIHAMVQSDAPDASSSSSSSSWNEQLSVSTVSTQEMLNMRTFCACRSILVTKSRQREAKLAAGARPAATCSGPPSSHDLLGSVAAVCPRQFKL